MPGLLDGEANDSKFWTWSSFDLFKSGETYRDAIGNWVSPNATSLVNAIWLVNPEAIIFGYLGCWVNRLTVMREVPNFCWFGKKNISVFILYYHGPNSNLSWFWLLPHAIEFWWKAYRSLIDSELEPKEAGSWKQQGLGRGSHFSIMDHLIVIEWMKMVNGFVATQSTPVRQILRESCDRNDSFFVSVHGWYYLVQWQGRPCLWFINNDTIFFLVPVNLHRVDIATKILL